MLVVAALVAEERFGMILVLTLLSRSSTPATMGFVAPSDCIQLGHLISVHVPRFSADEHFVVNAVPAKLHPLSRSASQDKQDALQNHVDFV